MQSNTVIQHRIDLLVRLINTVTGMAITGTVDMYRNGVLYRPLPKDAGNYIFINIGRDDFQLRICVPGYFEAQLDICYEQLGENPPFIEVNLIPVSDYSPQGSYLTMEGTLTGLSGLDAVKSRDSPCMIREFDEKKCVMTVYIPHHLQLDLEHYAVVNPNKGTYEAVVIKEQISEQKFKLTKKLELPFENYSPVCRRVFGIVHADGSYLLRVPDFGSDANWIVRCLANGKEGFQMVDFHCLKDNMLLEPADQVQPETLEPVPLEPNQERGD